MKDRTIYTAIIIFTIIMGLSAMTAGVCTGTVHNVIIGIAFLTITKTVYSNTMELWKK